MKCVCCIQSFFFPISFDLNFPNDIFLPLHTSNCEYVLNCSLLLKSDSVLLLLKPISWKRTKTLDHTRFPWFSWITSSIIRLPPSFKTHISSLKCRLSVEQSLTHMLNQPSWHHSGYSLTSESFFSGPQKTLYCCLSIHFMNAISVPLNRRVLSRSHV